MSAADRQAARVLGAPIVTEPDPLPPEPACSEALGPAATGSLYLDPADGELVQVLPPSAWLPERWGPPADLPVVGILAPAPRSRNKPGEVAQRDLTGWARVPPAALEALEALRALAGADGAADAGVGVLAGLATAAAKRADAIGCGFATHAGDMPPAGWVSRLAQMALDRGDFAEMAALALVGLSLAGVAGAPRRYATGDVECSHCRGALANGPDGLCAGCRVGLAGASLPLVPAGARWAADVAPDATDEGGR